MHAALADAVYAVFNRGIAVRERLEAGDPIDWEREHERVHTLLNAFVSVEDTKGSGDFSFVFSEHANHEERRRLTHVTIGFALTCWLDEFLTLHVPPETQLPDAYRFGNAEGASRFWDEARYAETRGDLEAIEVMYLCVMLGFRGPWRGETAQVEAWAERIRAKLDRMQETWTMPASLEAPRLDRRLADDRPARRMAFTLMLTFALFVPLGLAWLWR